MDGVAFDLTVSLSFLLSVATLIYAWWRTRSQHLEDKIGASSARLDRHDARINSIEQTVQGLPAQRDIHQLQLTLAEVRGEMREMRASMEGSNKIMSRVESIVSRHEDHLLEGARK